MAENDPRSADGDSQSRQVQNIVQRAAPPRPGSNDNWLVGMLSEGRIMVRRQQAKIDDFLPDVEAITERRHSPFATLLVGVLFTMVIATVVWMAISKIDQVVSSMAVVRPTGKAKIVNHAEPGRVVKIMVTEGQNVERDDVLVRFDSDLIDQEILKLTAQYSTLAGEVARLEAEIEDKPLTFPEDLIDQPRVRADQEALFHARKDQIFSRRAAADNQVQQAEARADGLRRRVSALNQSVKIIQTQFDLLKPVVDKDYFSRIRYYSIERDLTEQNGLLAQQRWELIAAERAHAEAMDRRALIDREARAEALRQLNASKADRDRFKAALEQQKQLKRNLDVRAPENGTVKDLKVLAIGQSFRAGEPLMGIVPSDQIGLELEARVNNNDRGSVEVGQAVMLKFTAYDWIKYGVLNGRVVHIDRDATNPATDDSGQTRATQQPYFRVIIKFDHDPDTGRPLTSLLRDGIAYPVTAGMSAIAELHMGERTILEFFTDRIFSTVKGSFREK